MRSPPRDDPARRTMTSLSVWCTHIADGTFSSSKILHFCQPASHEACLSPVR
jgi:hypothetical protein